MNISIITPDRYIGTIMELSRTAAATFLHMEYLDQRSGAACARRIEYRSLCRDADRRLLRPARSPAPRATPRSTTTFSGYRPAELVKLDILVNGEPVDALSMIIAPRTRRSRRAARSSRSSRSSSRARCSRCRSRRPSAAQDHRPRDDPGDAQERARQVLRRRHHPQAQAAGEAEGGQEADEARSGQVEIPQEAFMAVLKLER